MEALLKDREDPTKDRDNKDRDNKDRDNKDRDNVPASDKVREPFRPEQADERQVLALDKAQVLALDKARVLALDKGNERQVSSRRDELDRDRGRRNHLDELDRDRGRRNHLDELDRDRGRRNHQDGLGRDRGRRNHQDGLGRDRGRHRVEASQAKVPEMVRGAAATATEQARPVVSRTPNDHPPIAETHADLEDAAEFFRRGDEGEYPESLSPHDIALPERESEAGERDVLDPATLAQRAARTARFRLWVSRGTGALALATVLAFVERARQSASHDVVDERTPTTSRSNDHATAVSNDHATAVSNDHATAVSDDHRTAAPNAPSIGNTQPTAALTKRPVTSARKPMAVRRTAPDQRTSTRAQDKKVWNASLTVESTPTARFSD